jgi:hypothetical protein
MSSLPNLIVSKLTDRFERLRFPTLFLILAALFVFDLFIPDFIPFVDEIILGLVTLMVGNLKRKKSTVTIDAEESK